MPITVDGSSESSGDELPHVNVYDINPSDPSSCPSDQSSAIRICRVCKGGWVGGGGGGA